MEDSPQQLKVLAPVITRDVTLPNTNKKVPMVMVPVPDSRTLMAIPLSALNQKLKDSQMEVPIEEQQARDLLNWNDGIGTLDGCDLRFKINPLGCLELLDSDDESAAPQAGNGAQHRQPPPPPTPIVVANNSSNSNSNTNNNNSGDKAFDRNKQVKQISPGSSLLRGGPDVRRPKSTSTANSLLKKAAEQSQNSILLEKLVPRQKLDEIGTSRSIEQWTTEDVKNFVDGIPGCAGYGELFDSQQICGKSLMYLDQKDLLDVINIKLGPAVKIYHAISLLKSGLAHVAG